MKTKILSLGLVVAMMACAKTSDPAPTPTTTPGSCSLTFKGVSYSLSLVICVTAGSVEGLTGGNSTGTQSLIIAKDNDDASSSSITFSSDVSSATYVGAEFITSLPTITVSGKSWTFSGTLKNTAPASTDTGTISGSCTCP